MKPSFIDIHCHLEMLPDIPQAIENAQKAGVIMILTQGVNPETNRKALELSQKYKEVKACMGMYPIDALKLSDAEIETEIAFIRSNVTRIAAIGEVGMDFKEQSSLRAIENQKPQDSRGFKEDEKEHERQKAIFKKFIELSQELHKPIIIHSRKAELECIELLESLNAKNVIMHCFCGKWKIVERIQKNGWFLTVPTSVKNSQQFQAIARETPLTQLFCETDAPFLHPEKKYPNEPALVVESYKKIAELKKISLEEVREMVAKNFERVMSETDGNSIF